tara:strand:+ start:415 stop:597 length:183 start_codon:yes stop_codon:yes gene_type:complete
VPILSAKPVKKTFGSNENIIKEKIFFENLWESLGIFGNFWESLRILSINLCPKKFLLNQN